MSEEYNFGLADRQGNPIGNVKVEPGGKAASIPDSGGLSAFTGTVTVRAADKRTILAKFNFTETGIELEVRQNGSAPYKGRILKSDTGANVVFYNAPDFDLAVIPSLAHLVVQDDNYLAPGKLNKFLNRRCQELMDEHPHVVLSAGKSEEVTAKNASWYIEELDGNPVTYVSTRNQAIQLCSQLQEAGFRCYPEIPAFAPSRELDRMKGSLEIRSVMLPKEAFTWLREQGIECQPVPEGDSVNVKKYLRQQSPVASI